MIDLDSVNACLPAFDLAYLFTTFWTREQRQDGGREMACLQRYHRRLEECGVTSYSMDQLLQDYRLSIAYNALHPVWDQQRGASAAYWQPKLRCCIEAFDDWDCLALA